MGRARTHTGIAVRGRAACGILAVLVSIAGPGQPAGAQEFPSGYSGVDGVADLAQRCAGGNSGWVSRCRELSLAVLAVQQGVGLASALGSDVPGTSSTMGRRLGSVPRTGISVSVIALPMAMPRVAGETAGELAENKTVTVAGLRGAVAAGVLDGFQLAPGFGGVLSVDLIGSYTLLRLPQDAGFTGTASGVGLGARVGILRESFTLPGISVSAARRWHGEIQAGDLADGHAGELKTELMVSSLRAMVGKNWFVLGLMGGVGWDRYEGDATVSVPRGAGDPSSVGGGVTSERTLYFVSGWFNFLISQLSLEIGVADGVADPFADRRGGYDPAAVRWFAAGALRITL